MNGQRDIERVLDAWFVDGSSHMPDRLFDAVLDEVDRMPQRRRPWSNLRARPMSLPLRLAAAAALIVIVGGAGLALFGRASDNDTVGRTLPPSASPGPEAPVPEALRHPFLGELRESLGAVPDADRSILEFTDSRFSYNGNELRSTASLATSGQLHLVLDRNANGCHAGDPGYYTWTQSPGGTRTTFTMVADACAARASIIAGDWLRSDCETEGNACIGPLEAGSYVSYFIDPYIEWNEEWHPRMGAIAYEVPVGWANTADYPSQYRLAPLDAPDGTEINVFSEILAAGETCFADGERPADSVGRTASDLATWLGRLDGLVATAPVATTVGGLDGFRLEVRLDAAWSGTCPFSGGIPYHGLFVDPDPNPGLSWGVAADNVMRFWLLDLEDGRAVLIDFEAPTPAAFDEFADEAGAIVQSMEFAH